MHLASLFFVFQCLSVLALVAPGSNSGVRIGLDYSRSYLVQQSHPQGQENKVGEASKQVSLHQTKIDKRENKIWRKRIQLALPDKQGHMEQYTLHLVATNSDKGVFRVKAGPYLDHIVYAVDPSEAEGFKGSHFHPKGPTVLGEGEFKNTVNVAHRYILSSACEHPKSITLEVELPILNVKGNLKKKYTLTLSAIVAEDGVQRYQVDSGDYLNHIVYAVEESQAGDFFFSKFHVTFGGPTVVGVGLANQAGMAVKYLVSSECVPSWRKQITLGIPDEKGNSKEYQLQLRITDVEEGVFEVSSGPYAGHVVYAVDASKARDFTRSHFHLQVPKVLGKAEFKNEVGVKHWYILSSACTDGVCVDGPKNSVPPFRTSIILELPDEEGNLKVYHLHLKIKDLKKGVLEIDKGPYLGHIVYAVDLSKAREFKDSHFHPQGPKVLGEGSFENKATVKHQYIVSSECVRGACVDGPTKHPAKLAAYLKKYITVQLPIPDGKGKMQYRLVLSHMNSPEAGVQRLRVVRSPYLGHIVYAVDMWKVEEFKRTHFHQEGERVLGEGGFTNKAEVKRWYIVSSAYVRPRAKKTRKSRRSI